MLMWCLKGFAMESAGKARARCALAVPALALAFGVLASASPARADFRVCNATQNLVGVGIGYRAKAGWITEGWWHIEKSSCKTLIEGPLSSRFYYLYAEDAERGGRRTPLTKFAGLLRHPAAPKGRSRNRRPP